MSGRVLWFSDPQGEAHHLAEMRRFAESLSDDLGPMFGRDVVRLIDQYEATAGKAASLAKRVPRCNGTTRAGYRCAQGAGHGGAHTHPSDLSKAEDNQESPA